MGYATKIIEKFGGTRAMAAVLRMAPSTVQSWKVSGRIPDRHKTFVLDKALASGIAISPADFFDLPPRANSRTAARARA